jgi:citrate lyase subunit beta/citryl-CoA lyase
MSFEGVRTGLITPGLDLELMDKASRSAADVIQFELEDGVPPSRKIEARQKIAQALQKFDWSGKLTLVRVNAYSSGFLEDDIEGLAKAQPTAFLLGKCEGPSDVQYADRLLTRVERLNGTGRGTIKLAAMIERAAALQSIDEVANASPRMIALSIGPSDLADEIGYRRSYHGIEPETTWVRSRVVVAAHTAGLLAIDSPYVPYRDLQGTFDNAKWSYRLGFDVKKCISPRQIDVVARAFTPDDEEVAWAKAALEGEAAAHDAGEAVWIARDMMFDRAHVARARRILAAARRSSSANAEPDTPR